MNLIVASLAIFSEFAGVAATAVQLHTLIRTKNVRGISVIKNTLMGSSMIGWLVYGTSAKIWPVVIANAIMLPMMVCMLYLLAKHKNRKTVYVTMLVCGAMLGTVMLVLPPVYAGWLSVSFMIVALSPQFKKVLTEKRIDGLSLRAEVLWLSVGFTTFAYAAALRAGPLVVAGLVGILYSTTVLVMLRSKHPRHKR